MVCEFGNCSCTVDKKLEHRCEANTITSLPNSRSLDFANLWQVAEKALFRIRQLQSDVTEVQTRLGGEDLGVTWSWKMEEAKLRWAKGERDTAMYLLKSLGGRLEKVQW